MTASQPVLGRAYVAVADHRDRDGVLHRGDPLPARVAGVALLAGAAMQRDGVQAAVLGDLRQLHADDVGVVPAEPELHGEGNRDGLADPLEDDLDERQVAQQTGAAVAVHDALGRAAEVQVDDIEARILADACAVGERLGVRAEDLRGDRVLVLVVGQVALALGLAHAREAVGGGELRHDEAAAGVAVAGLEVYVCGG
jgi:hypothetical protein